MSLAVCPCCLIFTFTSIQVQCTLSQPSAGSTLESAALTWLCLQAALLFTIAEGPGADDGEASSLDVMQRIGHCLAIVEDGLGLLQ
jgi:hypothetical protein